MYGIMGSLMTDNGEFSLDEMREITSILNVKVCTTAGESAFQNGLHERVHAVTDMMLLKLEAENPKTDSQTLLSWANMARNSLQMSSAGLQPKPLPAGYRYIERCTSIFGRNNV